MDEHGHDAHASAGPSRDVFWLVLITLIIATAALASMLGGDDEDTSAEDDTDEHALVLSVD